MILDQICEEFPEESFLYPTGFEDAVIGYENNSMRLIMDVDIIIQILIQSGMSYIDAIDHCDYNIINSYVGEKTPIYLHKPQ